MSVPLWLESQTVDGNNQPQILERAGREAEGEDGRDPQGVWTVPVTSEFLSRAMGMEVFLVLSSVAFRMPEMRLYTLHVLRAPVS